jgi:hypothetical protein
MNINITGFAVQERKSLTVVSKDCLLDPYPLAKVKFKFQWTLLISIFDAIVLWSFWMCCKSRPDLRKGRL